MAEDNDFTRHADELWVPARALGGLVLANTEHLTRVHIEGVRRCADAMLASWREALPVRDAQGLGAYLLRQAESVNALARELGEATRLMLELSHYYADEMRKVVNHSLAGVTRRAA
ncbi:MAG: hypothetical protein OEN20_06685 [Gammaproteobacteria bacterium]|nr:hypothetical protein [Gammaproteobacteria bacterium]